MAIPDKQQPYPQRIRPIFRRTGGLSAGFTVQPMATQGTPNDPATQVKHLAVASGSRTFTVTPPNPIIVDVPLTGVTTPFLPAGVVSMVADAPVVSLPEGMTLGSVQVVPMVVLVGQSTPLGARSIGRGMSVKRFLVRVTIHVGNFAAAGQQATVAASARLFSGA